MIFLFLVTFALPYHIPWFLGQEDDIWLNIYLGLDANVYVLLDFYYMLYSREIIIFYEKRNTQCFFGHPTFSSVLLSEVWVSLNSVLFFSCFPNGKLGILNF